jgi:hypothetical protein
MKQMGEKDTITAVAVFEVRRLLGRTKYIWKNNIKTDHKEILPP